MALIIGISGSLRAASFNSALLRAAQGLMPPGSVLDIASIKDIPLYDGDLEAAAFPQAVTDLKERIVKADGLLLASPEYNNGVPGVLKNTVDWLSRPSADMKRVFDNRPVAIIGATPGRGATSLAQAAWLPTLRTLGTRAWFGGRMGVASAGTVFDKEGNLVDTATREYLKTFIEGFVRFVQGAA
jgi:NAD(P)H-dependent FMN reductase